MMSRLFVVLLTIGAVLAAGWFMMRRPDISYTTLESVYTNDESRFTKSGQEQMFHFRDVGPRKAPVVVLVHGFSASLHTWEPWVRDLRKDYRVISLDLPGHGLSRCVDNKDIGIPQFVAAVDQVTESLGVDRYTLVGSSMGGHTAWAYAVAHPEKLEGLVLVDAAGWLDAPGEGEKEPMVFKLLRNPVARALMKDLDMTSLIRSGLEDSFHDASLVTDEMVERYVALGRAPCHRDALLKLAGGATLSHLASKEELQKISVPALILHGEADNLVPVSHAQKFADAIPGAVLKTYPGVGHIPQEEIPAESVQDLRSFLAVLNKETDAEVAQVTSGN